MNQRFYIILILVELLSIYAVTLGVTYTCQSCVSLKCSSNTCYNLDGAGFSNFQICSKDSCTIGSQYQQWGTECSINSQNVLCSSKCCISPTRQSYMNRRCADGLQYGSKYCQGQLSIAAVGGIIFGSIVGFILISIGICIVFNRCFKKDKQDQKKPSSIISRRSSSKTKKPKSGIKSKVSQKKSQEKNIKENSYVLEIKLDGIKKNQNTKINRNHDSGIKLTKSDEYI